MAINITDAQIKNLFPTYFEPGYTGQLNAEKIKKILEIYSNKEGGRTYIGNKLNLNQVVVGRILKIAQDKNIIKKVPPSEFKTKDIQRVRFDPKTRKIHNVIRQITDFDRKQNPDIPANAKYRIVFATPQGKTTKIPKEFIGVKYFENKESAEIALNKRLKADFKTAEDPEAAKLKRQRTRSENIKAVTKGSSPADKAAVKTIEKNIQKINKYFKEDPDRINNTAFGKNIKKMMALRLDKESGNLITKFQPDDYYKNKAAQGQLFDLFDVNPVAGKKRGGRFVTNLNISPNVFNRAFVGSQLTNYFKRDKINPNVTKQLDDILKSFNIKVDLPTVGKIGATEADVAFDSKTGSFPRILKTLENLEAPDEIKDLFKSTKLTELKSIPGVTTADKIDIPEKSKIREMFQTAFKKVPKKGKVGLAAAAITGIAGKGIADELPIEYNNEIGAFVDPKTDDKVSQATLLDWAADNPMPTAAIASTPLLSKTVRKGTGKLLSGLLSALGSSAAGLTFAGMTVKDNLDEGKNIVDATVDPMVGLELLYPEAYKRFGGKGLQNALGRALSLGRVGAMMTPVGLGIGALGLGKMGIEAAMKEREKILGMTEEEKTNYLADQYESFGGVFGEGA
jgi:hypothetical protein